MNMHMLLDNISTSIGAKFFPKYFRNGYEAKDISAHISAIKLSFPQIIGEGDYKVLANTLVGELDCAFRIAQWKGEDYDTIIYHHGASEIPFDYGFNRIFPLKKDAFEFNFILVRAPFHTSTKEFKEGIHTFSSFVAMLSSSLSLVEQLVQYSRSNSKGSVLVSGTSLGGFITNLHHIHHNTANYYAPLLAGVAMYDAFLYSSYSKAVAQSAKENSKDIRKVLDFEEAFKERDNSNVFPLLGLYDQLVRYQPQKDSYGECSVDTIPKGHFTGALAYKHLREHITSILTSNR